MLSKETYPLCNFATAMRSISVWCFSKIAMSWFVARILFADALFVRKGNIRNAALLRFAAVFHNEMDTIADNDSHRIDRRTPASLRDGGLPSPAQASAA
jgi:hypothetical protein